MRGAAALLLVLLAALLAAAPATAAEPRVSLPDIEDEVMCVSCGTALNVSGAPSADRTREFIRRRIAEGLTKDQIKDRLVAEYGRNVLATPPASGRDLAAWVVPGLLALIALATVALTAKRWRRTGTDPDPDAAAGRDLTDADARRLESDMRTYDL